MSRAIAWTALLLSLALSALFSSAHAGFISVGTPTTTVPTYLSDGTYAPAIPNLPTTLPAGEFLLPIQITGAANLQLWQFDLSFDTAVVQEVDPGDSTSGIYGARFDPLDPDTLSFILSGFPDNSSGLVSTVAGQYPSLTTGPTGNGPLAYILFQFQSGQETKDPGFSTSNVSTLEQVPEPSTLALLATLLLISASRMLRGATCRRRS